MSRQSTLNAVNISGSVARPSSLLVAGGTTDSASMVGGGNGSGGTTECASLVGGIEVVATVTEEDDRGWAEEDDRGHSSSSSDQPLSIAALTVPGR